MPYEAVERLNCQYLRRQCLYTCTAPSQTSSADSGYHSSLSSISESGKSSYELYVPSLPSSTRDDPFSYHLTTRNVFAYAVGRPLVGERLSSALADLWQRLQVWAPESATIVEFTTYLEKQGYLNFSGNAEHALACLKFADSARARDIWIDAFTHCVGMHERLYRSPEFAGLSNTTTALITRASLEMDLHIVRVVRAVGVFLEEELGTEHLGLSKPARDHLDHFRSFLHSFYVDRLGYFPPSESIPWHRSPWPSMHNDFQNLYNYLVDADSSRDWTSTRGLTGGICVVQNVEAFDSRHGYDPLPNPLPLLPEMPVKRRASLNTQTGLLGRKLTRTSTVPQPKITTNQALAIATNCLKSEVMVCSLVQEYQRFERQKLDPKIDPAEARKVRWILIYGVLQMLNSIVRAPKEVRDTKKATYPLCVLTAGCPPWVGIEQGVDKEVVDNAPTPTEATLVPEAMDAPERRPPSPSRISIHPDCEADCAEDFFAANSIVRHDSVNDTPAPLRITTQLSRTVSMRRSSMHSSVQALQKSVVGSLSRRNSNRRDSAIPEPRKMRSHCEIVVEDYGNGMHWESKESRPQTAFRSELDSSNEVTHALREFDFGLAGANSEPIFDDNQLAKFCFEPETTDDIGDSPRESHFSFASGDLLDSNRSSYVVDSDSADTDLSSWDSGSDKGDHEGKSPSKSVDFAKPAQLLSPTKQLCYRPSNPRLNAASETSIVTGGCYVPSGARPTAKANQQRKASNESAESIASSVYPEHSNQAADISEEETRGRRKTRGPWRLPSRELVTAR